MGPVDSPATTELSETIRFVIPAEDRDFSRPREPFWANDIANAEDDGSRSEFIKQVQQLLKNNPIGPSYLGPIDGKETRHLKDIAIRFGWDLEKTTGDKIIVTPGDRISESAFSKAWKILQDHLKGKSNEKSVSTDKKSQIDSFKSFFSKSQPIIGSLYQETGDEKQDMENLITAAQETESLIAELINNNKAHGMIWNSSSKSFNTTPTDVKSALDLIVKHKKASFLNKKDRKLAFYSFLNT